MASWNQSVSCVAARGGETTIGSEGAANRIGFGRNAFIRFTCLLCLSVSGGVCESFLGGELGIFVVAR